MTERKYLVFRFSGIEVQERELRVLRNGEPLAVEPKAFKVLVCLLRNSGQLVSKDDLIRAVWGDTAITDNSLSRNVALLRRVLEDDAREPRYIETVSTAGYRFVCKVEASEEDSGIPESPNGWSDLSKDGPPKSGLKQNCVEVPGIIAGDSIRRKPPPRFLLATFAAICLLAVAWLLRSHYPLSTWAFFRNQPVSPHRQTAFSSLAVLPLQNLSNDPAQEYFADGITESLIGRLSMIRGLRVISRTSSMQFKKTHMSAPEIAKALNVDALVEGSVIREGSRVRVHAQLIRAATDEHFWSETYDREMQDALALESDVVQAIAQHVEVTVTGDERARLVAARAVSPEVYESYLKGRRLVEGNTRTEIESSIPYFEQAIRKDETFAPAYLGLATAYGNLGSDFVGGEQATETRPKEIIAARKALELDPASAEAHVLLGEVFRVEWQWNDAEAEFNRALQLNPNNASAHRDYSQLLLRQGRKEEALAWALRARELDPLGRFGNSTVAWTLYQSRRYDEAIRELQSALAVQADLENAKILAFVLISKGQPAEAIPILEKLVSLSDRGPGLVGLLATAYVRTGRRTDALRLINELNHRREKGYIPAEAFVFPFMALGDREQAFASLERSFHEKSTLFQYLKTHPLLDPLRDDPRFYDLIRRVGTTP